MALDEDYYMLVGSAARLDVAQYALKSLCAGEDAEDVQTMVDQARQTLARAQTRLYELMQEAVDAEYPLE